MGMRVQYYCPLVSISSDFINRIFSMPNSPSNTSLLAATLPTLLSPLAATCQKVLGDSRIRKYHSLNFVIT